MTSDAEAVRVERGLDIAGTLGGKVGEENVVDAGRFRVRGEALDAVAHDGIEIGERDQRNLALRTHRPRDGENVVHRGSALQRALRGGLDYGAVGDRIGERHAELDGVRARLGEGKDDVGRGAVAARDVGDEAAS